MDEAISRAEELAKIGREYQLAELEYEDADVKIHIDFEPPQSPSVASFDPALLAGLSAATSAAPTTAPARGSVPESKAISGETINSPLAGVFYRCPGPDAPPYVEESAQVSAGQVLCIVEAMKLMNEITAERACKISKILVENAEAVEEGQPLFVIE